MRTTTLGRRAPAPRHRGPRVPVKAPVQRSPKGVCPEEDFIQVAVYRHMSDWPQKTPEEREKILREFKEPTADEINAFRLRQAIPRDWKIIPCAGSWVVESPLWPRTRPTPESHFFGFVKIYNMEEDFFDQFVVERMELAGDKPTPGHYPFDHD